MPIQHHNPTGKPSKRFSVADDPLLAAQFREELRLQFAIDHAHVRYDQKLWIVEPVTPAAYPPA